LKDIKSKINVDLIKVILELKIAYDAMHGAGQGVMDQILPLKVSIRGDFNPSFDGSHPEPLPQNTPGLIEAIVKNGCDHRHRDRW